MYIKSSRVKVSRKQEKWMDGKRVRLRWFDAIWLHRECESVTCDFSFFFFLFLFNFSPRFVLSFPRCAVLNHFTAYNVCKITSEMMYRHGMVFTSDRSSGIGCSRPRRRVFVVHEISGTPLRVRVSSKSIFIVFLFLSLFTRQILSILFDRCGYRWLRDPLFFIRGRISRCFTCVIEIGRKL